jgi:4'-phosphopantetheinyl transferase EntD
MDPNTHCCGPLSIFLVLPNQQIEDADLTAHSHSREKLRATELRHRQRQSEFLRSRWLIRQHIDFADPILPNSDGVIPWPAGLVGSISHKDGIAGFAFAETTQYLSIGIDLENSTHIKDSIATKICSARELKLLEFVVKTTDLSLDTALAIAFSFKEAIFKCHFPLGKKWFYFHDAEITEIDGANNAIHARLNITTSDYTPLGFDFVGHYTQFSFAESVYVMTCHVLPADLPKRGV